MVREGFSGFLDTLRSEARKRRIGWQIIACGARNSACEAYLLAMQSHPDAFNVLLVDAECPLSSKPWEHLHKNENWDLNASQDESCHLMVQVFESWLLSDVDALKRFYGQGFQESAIPSRPVENIAKSAVFSALKKATRQTQKGEYHKINHGPKILEMLDVTKVRRAAPHCDRFFKTLAEKIGMDS